MLKKIADAGITLGKLQAAYTNGREQGLQYLLGESVGNKVRVTKNKKNSRPDYRFCKEFVVSSTAIRRGRLRNLIKQSICLFFFP